MDELKALIIMLIVILVFSLNVIYITTSSTTSCLLN